jgi:hypothetical protein
MIHESVKSQLQERNQFFILQEMTALEKRIIELEQKVATLEARIIELETAEKEDKCKVDDIELFNYSCKCGRCQIQTTMQTFRRCMPFTICSYCKEHLKLQLNKGEQS